MLLKDIVGLVLGGYKHNKIYSDRASDLNVLWTYSKGYTDALNYENNAPFTQKMGYIIDAPDMSMAEFTRLVNSRLEADKLIYRIDISSAVCAPAISFSDRSLVVSRYKLLVLNMQLIGHSEPLGDVLFI